MTNASFARPSDESRLTILLLTPRGTRMVNGPGPPRADSSQPVLVGNNYFCHQQYLAKVPNGYDCHANTGVAFPA